MKAGDKIMNLTELETRLENEELINIQDGDLTLSYKKLKNNCHFDSPNSFGIVKFDNNSYGVYFAGEERGGQPYYMASVSNIEEAFEKLYNKIVRLKRIEMREKKINH